VFRGTFGSQTVQTPAQNEAKVTYLTSPTLRIQ